MRNVHHLQLWVKLSLIWAFTIILTSAVLAQGAETNPTSETIDTAPSVEPAAWIKDAINIVKFIEANELILKENSYEEYEKLVLNAPNDEKLDRLYELLVDAMFVGSNDVTEKYMPVYVSAIEETGSEVHQQSLKVLTVATQGYTDWTYDEAIGALEKIAFDSETHPFASIRALSIVGYLYGYSANKDRVVTTIQKMEALAKLGLDRIFIEKEIVGLKGFFASQVNDPEDMVKYSGEFLKLAYETDSLIFGGVFSANLTHLVMEYGDIASIDKIDEINQRIAKMTDDENSIFKAYTSCGESAVKLVRNTKALECFDKVGSNIAGSSQTHIRYYLYSAIAYARDGQVAKASANLNTVKNMPDVELSLYFKETIDWATSEVSQSQGNYVDAYNGLRTHFNKKLSSQKKEMGEITRSLRAYSEEKAALLEEKAEVLAGKEVLQHRIISRQRILILVSIGFAIILLTFLQIQRLNTRKLRKARKKTLEANRAIMTEARTDQLTRIGNRRAFYEYCVSLSKNSDLNKFTLAILDLDEFKLINDTFGHEAGDVMIQQTSQRLRKFLGEKGQVFRLGGDEFALVYLSSTDHALQEFQYTVRKALESPVKFKSKRFDLNWSVGAVNICGESEDPSKYLHQADYALYQAKEKRGPSFHIFSDADLEEINRESHLAEEVLWNLNSRSFTMFGQIVVSSANESYQPFGVEALLRAQTRSGDIISPETFIGHVVSAGKVSMFTKTSLIKSIEMLQSSDLNCPLLFNLSRHQITDANVLKIVTNALESTKFPANRLIIELSEYTLNQDLSAASETLKQFKRNGIRLALDDFGSGNTGFSSLLEFDFDLIKTDRKLLRSAKTSIRTKHLMSNLIDLSRKLNVLCVIEGLETPREVSFVKNLGGQVLQGFIFGIPEETPRFRSNLDRITDTGVDNRITPIRETKKLA